MSETPPAYELTTRSEGTAGKHFQVMRADGGRRLPRVTEIHYALAADLTPAEARSLIWQVRAHPGLPLTPEQRTTLLRSLRDAAEPATLAE